MSSSRTILSRPRTRLYDSNYNMGTNYYKSALDRIDKKYSGKLSSPTRGFSLPRDIIDRHDQTLADEDLNTSRRRAEKHITESNLFDSISARSNALETIENGLDEESSTALSRLRNRANRRIQSSLDDIDLDSTINNIKSRRIIDRSEKLLDTVGINESSRRALNEDISIKKSLKLAQEEKEDFTKWTPLNIEVDRESAAARRAKQTKNRLMDLEDEMNTLAEKQAVRERRAARLKQFVAETCDDSEFGQEAIQISRKERKAVHF